MTLTRSSGSTGMMRGMRGTGSFTGSEVRIAMRFANGRHERIAQYHNDPEKGIRYKGGKKVRHFLYLSQVDIRACVKAGLDAIGVKSR